MYSLVEEMFSKAMYKWITGFICKWQWQEQNLIELIWEWEFIGSNNYNVRLPHYTIPGGIIHTKLKRMMPPGVKIQNS